MSDAFRPEEFFPRDLFERITLFDNQTREVSATKRADGKHVVKVTVASTKFYGDAKGEEKETGGHGKLRAAGGCRRTP